ncbi:MAG TPA: radical SAM protein [Thermoplasmatales archaeon]|nr:radical SAM protein [Thermoplasmatales archaeon]
MIVFGSVPSRRLGRSLGINNIPFKFCTYSCIYCQLGRTSKLQIEREKFYNVKKIFNEVNKKIKELKGKIDYITFVPDGEPTLDINIGKEIEILRKFGYKIAVITNSSLLWREDVRNDILKADLISLKVDAVDKNKWLRINRPSYSLNLGEIMKGIKIFSEVYGGKIITETMLIKGMNDENAHLQKIADFLAEINIAKSYISIPTRPPAERWVKKPDEETINKAYQIFSKKIKNVELLTGYEGNEFFVTKNVKENLLSILAVHPMRKDALTKFLKKAGKNWELIKELIDEEEIVEVEYEGKKFYIRKNKNEKFNGSHVFWLGY